MAKSDSLLNLQGTLGGVTYVHSKRYGKHERKARSSSNVNDVFKENNRQIADANKPARLIKNVVDIYRQDFKGGMLWQRLVSYFKTQIKENKPLDVTGLRETEVHDDYYLTRLIRRGCEWSVREEEDRLVFTVNNMADPDFKRKFPDAYSISVIAIFPDFAADMVEHAMVTSDMIPLESEFKPVQFSFSIPAGANQYLIIMKVQAYERGNVCPGYSTRGMRFVAAGKLEEEQ